MPSSGPLQGEQSVAMRRELFAFVYEDHDRSAVRRKAEQYATRHLNVTSGADLSNQLDAMLDQMTDAGLITTRPRDELTSAGEEEWAALYVGSHLTHTLTAAVESTVLWAVAYRPCTGTPDRRDGMVRVAAEYAAYTHHRALFELLGHSTSREARQVRQLLRLAERPSHRRAKSLLDEVWITEINRACSHVGRRLTAPDPPPGKGLPVRVAWLTARLLELWRRTADDESDLPPVILSAWATALQDAQARGDAALVELCGSTRSARWDHSTDPFDTWPSDQKDWPTDPDDPPPPG